MLKITKASDPITVHQLVTVIYGAPGLGKSTLGYTADAPLLLDFDGGAYRAANRKDTVQISTWADVADLKKETLANYHTVIVDTAGRLLDYLSADIIAENPKLAYRGALSLQGYGQLKARFTGWLKLLRTYGLDVVLVSHMDEQRNGDDVIERLDIAGGSKNEIYKSADAMGRLYMRGGKRLLDFTPRENAFGKNPARASLKLLTN